MAFLYFINKEAEIDDYNFIFKIKIEDYPNLPLSGYPSEGYKSFNFDRSAIGNVLKVDWGNGTKENNPSSKVINYNNGEYTIKMKVESFSNQLKLIAQNITEFIKVPYELLPNYIDLSTNKIPKGGLLDLLNNLDSKYSTPAPLFEFVKSKQFIFKANGQVGHFRRDGRSANNKGFYRSPINGQEFLKTTPQEEANYSRNQAELDAAKKLVDKNWLVELSFDYHYRTLMPYTEAVILQDGEIGDIQVGCEVFHIIPNYNRDTKMMGGKVVRVNLRNGYWNDERFARTDPRRKILPQKIYAQWQVKRANEDSYVNTFIPVEVIDDGTGLYKKVKEVDLTTLNLQTGDKIRAIIYGKYGEIYPGSPSFCSSGFVVKRNHEGTDINYTLTI